jgi:hypothetical protein
MMGHNHDLPAIVRRREHPIERPGRTILAPTFTSRSRSVVIDY